jgi:hypothetical protein
MASMSLALSNQQQMTAVHNDLTRQIAEVRDLVLKGATTSGGVAPWLSKEDTTELQVGFHELSLVHLFCKNMIDHEYSLFVSEIHSPSCHKEHLEGRPAGLHCN